MRGWLVVGCLVVAGCRAPSTAPRIASERGALASGMGEAYGPPADRFDGKVWTDLPVTVLPPEARAGRSLPGRPPAPARVGFVELDGKTMLAIVGVPMGYDHLHHAPSFAQAFERAGATAAPLSTPTADAERWSTWQPAYSFHAPLPKLLVLLGPKDAPGAVRWLGAVESVREVALFERAPAFIVDELGNESGADDPIVRSVVALVDHPPGGGGLTEVAEYRLGPRSAGPCADATWAKAAA